MIKFFCFKPETIRTKQVYVLMDDLNCWDFNLKLSNICFPCFKTFNFYVNRFLCTRHFVIRFTTQSNYRPIIKRPCVFLLVMCLFLRLISFYFTEHPKWKHRCDENEPLISLRSSSKLEIISRSLKRTHHIFHFSSSWKHSFKTELNYFMFSIIK